MSLIITKKKVRSPNEWKQSLSTNRHISESQSATHKEIQLYNTYCKIDPITIFSIRPPGLMKNVDMVGKYYRWSNVSSKPLKDHLVIGFFNGDLKKHSWIDAIKCQILLRNKALHELILWLETIENEEDIDNVMVSLFFHLHHVTQNCSNLNNTNHNFPDFKNKHLFYDDDDDEHFPIPVYSGIKPPMET